MKLKKIVTLLILGAVVAAPALAEREWRGGRWQHGRHDGRLGWWWIVGGLWYFYPGPIYPYPDPYRPPVIIENNPPVVAEPQAPVQSAPPAVQTSPYWYYCEPSRTYYPYVSSCPAPWKQVPAMPTGAMQ